MSQIVNFFLDIEGHPEFELCGNSRKRKREEEDEEVEERRKSIKIVLKRKIK